MLQYPEEGPSNESTGYRLREQVIVGEGECPHPQSLALLNDAQCARLKGPFLDTEASLLNLTERFNPQ